MKDRQVKAVANAGECLQGIDPERLAGWNHYYAISQQGNTPAHNEAKYAVRNQWRHILAMANALHAENERLKADARLVPALVEALKGYHRAAQKQNWQQNYASEYERAAKVLASLPEEYR